MLLSKATYNWGIHEVINLKETNKRGSARNTKSQALFNFYFFIFLFRMSSSVERDEFSVVA